MTQSIIFIKLLPIFFQLAHSKLKFLHAFRSLLAERRSTSRPDIFAHPKFFFIMARP